MSSTVDKGVPEGAWRSVHAISPILNTWQVIAAIVAFVVYQNGKDVYDLLRSDWVTSHVGMVFIVVSVGLIVLLTCVAGYSYLAWRAMRWAVTDSAVWFREGIVFRSQRHARLDRIQAVDIIHPLLGRLFGLGKLQIEVAGGADSSLTFGYLRTEELNEARREILMLAAGQRAASTAQAGDVSASGLAGTAEESQSQSAHSADQMYLSGHAESAEVQHRTAAATAVFSEQATPVAQSNEETVARPQRPLVFSEDPERLLYTVEPGVLLASLLRSLSMIVAAVIAVAGIVGVGVAIYFLGLRSLLYFSGLAFGFVSFVGYIWGRFAGEFNFQAAVSPEGIRIRRGLTETRSQTIPPRRVHAVKITQPLLWRSKGWYRVTVLQAGYGSTESDTTGNSDVLLPVGTRAQAELALWLVFRDLGVTDVRPFLDEAFDGIRSDLTVTATTITTTNDEAKETYTPEGLRTQSDRVEGVFVPIPLKARRLDPMVWKRRAYALTDTLIAIRDGWPSKHVTFMGYERVQSLAVESGPWQRRLGLATVKVDAVPGNISVSLSHIEENTATRYGKVIAERSRLRRVAETPEKWLKRVESALEDVSVEESADVEVKAEFDAGK